MFLGGLRRFARQNILVRCPFRTMAESAVTSPAATTSTFPRVRLASAKTEKSHVVPVVKTGLQSSPSYHTSDSEALIDRTRDFVSVARVSLDDDKGFHRETFRIFHEWRRILFHLGKDDQDLLAKSAESIDALLHVIFLNQNKATADAFLKRSTKSKSSCNLIDFVTTGIYAWGRLSRIDSNAPEKAETLVEKLQELAPNNADTNMASAFAAMVYCWSQAADNPRSLERASHWFRQIEQGKNMTVSSETFNSYLRTIVRNGQLRSHDTQPLLKRYSFLKDGYTYPILVRGWMDSNDATSAQQAYEVLQDGLSYCMERPDQTAALQQLLFDYLNRNVKNSSNSATSNENVLGQIIHLQRSNPAKSLLQHKHFVVVMSGLASRGETEGVERLFEVMEELNELGTHHLAPDYQVLVIVLSALAKSKDLRCIESIERLLLLIVQQMISTSSTDSPISNHAFNVVLDFYSRVPDITKRRGRIESLLLQMTAWADQHDNPELLPDRISYSSLLRAIMEDNEGEVVAEIVEIVKEMEESGRPSMHPDANIYTLALEGFYRSGDPSAVEAAEKMKKRMVEHSEIRPDEFFSTLLMKVHGASGNAVASDKILSEMIESFESGNERCRPTEQSFLTALSSWERSRRRNAPDAALRVFNRMIALYEGGIQECRPSAKSFGQLMVILAKSEHAGKRLIARRLLSKMKQLDVAPDLMVLNWYIRVCGFGTKDKQDRQESWQDAKATLETLRNSRRGPNSHTYNSMLHACHSLFRNDNIQRLGKMKEILEWCKEDGLVDKRIVSTLKRLLPSQEYEEWTTLSAKNPRISMHTLPREWQRNKTSRQ